MKPGASPLPLIAALLAANCLPLYMVSAGKWDAREVLVLFWAENLIVGVFAVCRVLSLGHVDRVDRIMTVIMGGGVLYFSWTAAHGSILAALLDIEVPYVQRFEFLDELAWLFTVPLLVWFFFGAMPEGAWSALALLFAAHGAGFLWERLQHDDARKADPFAIILKPFARLVILAVTLLAGWLLLPKSLAVLLVLMKMALDALRVSVAGRDEARAAPP